MIWKDFISTLECPGYENKYEFHAPALYNELESLKDQLGIVELPAALKELYLQTNGVFDDMGDLIWPVQKVIEINKEYRTDPEFKDLYMSFDQLLFFSDAGNGDMFGYVVLNGEIRSDIFSWNHEDDSRKWVAPDLANFIKWWTNGMIST